MSRYKYTNAEVCSWAYDYLFKVNSLDALEQLTGVSHSTTWWCFLHRLPFIDSQLFRAVNIKLIHNNTSVEKEAPDDDDLY